MKQNYIKNCLFSFVISEKELGQCYAQPRCDFFSNNCKQISKRGGELYELGECLILFHVFTQPTEKLYHEIICSESEAHRSI